MERPKVSLPRQQKWVNEDTQMASMIKTTAKKVFNVYEWTFKITAELEPLKYPELKKRILNPFPMRRDVKTVIDVFLHLPDDMQVNHDRLISLLESFTLKMQERTNLCGDYEKWADWAQNKIAENEREIISLNEQLESKKTHTVPVYDIVDRPVINEKVDVKTAKPENNQAPRRQI
jgi:hypothetical protein